MRKGSFAVLACLSFSIVSSSFSVGAESSSSLRHLGDISILSDVSCSENRCISFRVESDQLNEDATGRLVITEPDIAVRGTIVIFTGGPGTTIWGEPIPQFPNLNTTPILNILDDWLSVGFRTVRVAWDESWWNGTRQDDGFSALATRPASITDWLATNVVTDSGPICIGGGSGGAAQVSYMLTRYGLEDRVSLAVPWSGFWMGRIDTGCLDEDSLNSELHFDDQGRRAMDFSFGFPQGEDGPCFRRDASFESKFREASISAIGDYHYPNTLVWHVIGGNDDVGLAHGLTYYAEMLKAGSPHVRLDVLPGVPHGLTSTESGRQKIRDIFLQECRAR